MMGVPVQRQRRLVLVERTLQPRTAEEWEDRFRLAYDGFFDRRVVRNGDLHLCLQLLQAVIELDCFALSDLDKGLDAEFSERHELVRRKAAGKTLGPREPDAIHLEAVSVEQVYAGHTEHAGQFVLVSALVVVIA